MAKMKLADRVAALEVEVAQLKTRLDAQDKSDPWMEDVWGAFANDPAIEEAMELGRKYRESLRPKPRKRRKQ